MDNARFIFIGVRDVRSLRKNLTALHPHITKTKWFYLGTDIHPKEEFSDVIKGENLVSIGEELNSIASQIKQTFLDWIVEIGKNQKNQLNWWCSSIASKSPYQTDIFLLICFCELVRNWLIREKGEETCIIVVQDPWLLWTLKRNLSNRKEVSFPFSYTLWRNLLLEMCYWITRVPLSMIYLTQLCLRMWRIAKHLYPEDLLSGHKKVKRAILVHTWIEERCFLRNGDFWDPYTERLESVLSQEGEIVKRITPFQIKRTLLRRLKNFPSRFIVTAAFIRFRDLFRSIFYWFRINKLNQISIFKEWEFAPLFYREILRTWGHPGFSRYYLSYLTMRRIARNSNGKVKCIIYPFENQPWEKLLCLAWRHEAPHVKLIGYQHSSFGSLLLDYFLGKGESTFAPLPDKVVANGQFSLESFLEAGYPSSILVNGGALRFEYLHRLNARDISRTIGPTDSGQVLVVLPCSFQNASTLLNDLIELFPEPFLYDGKRSQINFIIKCHPDLPIHSLMKEGEKLPKWFQVSSVALHELFSSADVCLFSPPTTSWWEAFLVGLPVLRYRGEFLDIDSVPELGEGRLPICTKLTMKQKLRELLVEGVKGRREISPSERQEIMNHVFSPVVEQVWRNLVEADPKASHQDETNHQNDAKVIA